MSLLIVGASLARAATPASPVDFNRQIRPILNQNCVACHGGVKAAGDISFVFREEATKSGKSGRPTIKPGDPAASELIRRLTTRDPELRMPPVDHGAALPAAQVELFRQWIREGAAWSEHWAFVAPKPQAIPALADAALAAAARGPIDHFILARLAREMLSPAPAADRATLLRRASFDLTGLPPTAAELTAFLSDASPDAYEKQVDRLLASPHFGERWAAPWLDLARYADTKGYEKDLERSVWPYRDWLVDAFNRNLPYDQFIVEQLAGDLLPHPTPAQRIATSFHRQTQVNDEGGSDDEEFRMSAVLDRTSTTWLAFNGVTFNCVQCHSHPYDPIRHREFYRFLAFFNTSADADYSDDFPTARIPTDPARAVEADTLQQTLLALRATAPDAAKPLATDSSAWHALPFTAATATPAATLTLRDGEVFAEGTVATKAIFELTASTPVAGTTALRLEVPPLDAATARHTPEIGFVVAQVDLELIAPDGTVRPLTVRRFFADTAGPTTTVADAPGYAFAANPSLFRPRWLVAALAAPFDAPAGTALRVRLRHGVQIAERPAPARRLRITTSADPRWSELAASPALANADERIATATRALAAIPGVNLPVMAELPPDERRETRLFNRGNFLEKTGPALTPGVPALFPPLPPDAPADRLTLARWFVAPEQPLTARVAVNRFWEQLFGLGLVETLEDFGSVGEPPSHPELLDWLALHFARDLRWDTKALLRELVTSATYRQSAHATPAQLRADPRNRLLARGPRNRLSAEMVRDQALVASGLFSPRLHGPPVMPPQPAGVWNSVYSNRQWVDATGPDRYRRALYTFWKRTSAYPSMLTFDAPSRDLCTLRRVPTNTPLQSLVTLNDPVFAEAAAALARRMATEAGPALRAQLAHGFRLVTSRDARDAEISALASLHDDALKLAPDPAHAPGSPPPELAALTAVATALLNLDAALTK